MKKISTNTSILSIILGATMLLAGLVFLDGVVVIGVFGIILGAAYIFAGLLTSLNLKNDVANMLRGIIYLSAFPLFTFVYYLVVLIYGAKGFGVSDWIFAILILLTSLAGSALGAASFFIKNEAVNKLLRLAVYLFIGLLVILQVFPIGGGIASIGDLVIYEIVHIVCYFLIAKGFVEIKE